MATSVVPALFDAIIAAAIAALPGTAVSDGIGNTEYPGSYLMIGISDDGPNPSTAGRGNQEWANANGTARDERGDITCLAVSWNGDASAKAARDGVFAMMAAVETMCRATPALGVAGVLWTSVGTDWNWEQDQDNNGAVSYLVFTIAYRARI